MDFPGARALMAKSLPMEKSRDTKSLSRPRGRASEPLTQDRGLRPAKLLENMVAFLVWPRTCHATCEKSARLTRRTGRWVAQSLSRLFDCLALTTVTRAPQSRTCTAMVL